MNQVNQSMDTRSVMLSGEIDFFEIFKSIRRRWKFVVFFTLAGVSFQAINYLLSKPVWSGSFKILIDSPQNGSGSLTGGGALMSILSAGGGIVPSDIENEIRVLKSPEVLKPVYNYFLNNLDGNSSKATDSKYTDLIKWTSNYSLSSPINSSIIYVNFSSFDPSVIVPVLNKTAQVYQDYSVSAQLETLRSNYAYALDRLNSFRIKASKSSQDLDKFALAYGIDKNSFAGAGNSGKLDLQSLISGAQGSTDSSQLLIPGSTTGSRTTSPTSQGSASAHQELATISRELAKRREKFYDNDPVIKSLLASQSALRSYIGKTAGGVISLPPKNSSRAISQDILIEFNELKRKSDQDASTLASLENTVLNIELAQAKKPSTWRIISKPTLDQKPVSKNIFVMILLGSTLGFILGGFTAILVDFLTGKIFSRDKFASYLSKKALCDLCLEHEENLDDALSLFVNKLSRSSSLGIYFLGDFDQAQASKLSSIVSKLHPNSHRILKAHDIASLDHTFVFVCEGGLTFESANKFNTVTSVCSSDSFSWFWVLR